MSERRVGSAVVHACEQGHGVFLARQELSDLIDAETNWHRANTGQHTAPLPRITPDMTAPPRTPRAVAWVATLFR